MFELFSGCGELGRQCRSSLLVSSTFGAGVIEFPRSSSIVTGAVTSSSNIKIYLHI